MLHKIKRNFRKIYLASILVIYPLSLLIRFLSPYEVLQIFVFFIWLGLSGIIFIGTCIYGIRFAFWLIWIVGLAISKITFRFYALFAIIVLVLMNISLHTRLINIENRFGGATKLACREQDLSETLKTSVVRIIGSLGEGSGFPVSEHEIITNFHVIDGEPSPKIAFSDGTFVTPTKVMGDKERDFAILTVEKSLTPMIFYGSYGKAKQASIPQFGEPIYAAGYAFGTDLTGPVTINKGAYEGIRNQKQFPITMVQTDITLNHGMSGGPLTDACGQVIGVNTEGVAGLSFFIDIASIQQSLGSLTSKDIAKLTIDVSTPQGVVEAFYAYISARDLKKAYELVSIKRRDGQTFEQWQEGYSQTMYVNLIESTPNPKDKNSVHIKLSSADWVDGDLAVRYFEGDWRVTDENGKLKLSESHIQEVKDPGYRWFYGDF